ncbi:MAG: hypothetical protein ACYCZC_09360, partial [Acidithiobacillus sp.]
QEAKRRRRQGGDLYLYRVKPAVMEILRRGDFLEELGPDHVFETRDEVIRHVFSVLDRDICRHCQQRIFDECKTLPPPLGRSS